MEDSQSIKRALEETEILKSPDKLISTSESTELHYFVLAEPIYLEMFKNEGPETKIREGWISWEKPRLLTPSYIMKMEGFSKEAEKALKMLAQKNPDLAGLFYKMRYKRKSVNTTTVSRTIEETYKRLEGDIKNEESLTAIIKGIDELWDVSLMKFIQQLVIKSAYMSQMPYYKDRGFVSTDNNGHTSVTRNLEGLPIAAKEDIEKMFNRVERGKMKPVELKQELDQWGVYEAYEDRFLDLFRKE